MWINSILEMWKLSVDASCGDASGCRDPPGDVIEFIFPVPRLRGIILDRLGLDKSDTLRRCGALIRLGLGLLESVRKDESCLVELPALARAVLDGHLSYTHDFVGTTPSPRRLLVGSAVHGSEREGRWLSLTITWWVRCDVVQWFTRRRGYTSW